MGLEPQAGPGSLRGAFFGQREGCHEHFACRISVALHLHVQYVSSRADLPSTVKLHKRLLLLRTPDGTQIFLPGLMLRLASLKVSAKFTRKRSEHE